MVGILIFRFVHSRAMLVERVAGLALRNLLLYVAKLPLPVLHQIKVAQGSHLASL